MEHGLKDIAFCAQKHIAPWVVLLQLPGPWFIIKMLSYQYRKSHCGDKTILWPSYLHNGISYTGKTTSLYWIGALLVGSKPPRGARICEIGLYNWFLTSIGIPTVEIRRSSDHLISTVTIPILIRWHSYFDSELWGILTAVRGGGGGYLMQ